MQAYEDQMGIGRECKLRDKSVRKRKVRKGRGWRGKRREEWKIGENGVIKGEISGKKGE